jgi:dihydrofolate reductase
MLEEAMRKLVEITFMSLDGVIDAPDVVTEAQRYFSSNEEHEAYQKERLFAADALLLGRSTYEVLSKAYLGMASSGEGAPMDLVGRLNSIPKYVASTTLEETTWNATVLQRDIAEEVRKLKEQPGKDILKYGTGSLDRILLGEDLLDVLCIELFPFVLGHGTRLFEGIDLTRHLKLSKLMSFKNGTVILEYGRPVVHDNTGP